MKEITINQPEMCECGRLYKDRKNHLGVKMCSACYTGLSVDDLRKLWGSPVNNNSEVQKEKK